MELERSAGSEVCLYTQRVLGLPKTLSPARLRNTNIRYSRQHPSPGPRVDHDLRDNAMTNSIVYRLPYPYFLRL